MATKRNLTPEEMTELLNKVRAKLWPTLPKTPEERAEQNRRVAEKLRDFDSPAARARTKAFLASQPFPQYGAAPGRPGLLVKIDKDGTETIGRLVNRQWVDETPPSATRKK